MNYINKMLDVLFAFKLGLPVVWEDDYNSWWEVRNGHVFDFHHEYRVVHSGEVEKYLKELNNK
jgi:hypothetical protein